MPSRDEVRRFAASTSGRVGKREVARAFGLGPEHRIAVRELLKTLEREGELARAGGKRFLTPGRLPEQAVVQVTGTNNDGDALARPVDWSGPGAAPVIFMHPELRGRAALAPGQRVVARLKPIGSGKYEGRTLKRLESRPGQVLGLFRPAPAEDAQPYRRGRIVEAGRVVPTDRRVKADWSVPAGETGGAQADEIVLAEPLPHVGAGLKPVRIVERLGPVGDARSVSLICIHGNDIPHTFPPECVAAAEAAEGVDLDGRTDLRGVPLVTIDGEDARDFDDAVFAEPDGEHPGGWRIVVAIADVAHYVRPGSPLDREARLRGNSVYFPDRVVPMLPEALSNGWCSLKPGEPRGCLFVDMRIGADGARHAHRFGRGLMRSAARLTYEQVQAAHDARQHASSGERPGASADMAAPARSTADPSHGLLPEPSGEAATRTSGDNPPAEPADTPSDLRETRFAGPPPGTADEPSAGQQDRLPEARPGALPDGLSRGLLDSLYGAFAALHSARQRRGTLDLDLAERRVLIENGAVRAIVPRARLDSHRLIEEFMVLANVAAALELERLRAPCLYRVHAPPSPEKIEALRAFLDTLGIALKPAGELRPSDLDRVLKQVAGTPDAPLVNETVLRAQSQAEYDGENQGHFGLALAQYAHFTSPIRRYADLCVHRALIAALGLGPGGDLPEAGALADTGEHITTTERRAALAERDAIDRYIAAHMADKIGAGFSARISGVTRSGLFVTLPDSGATGLVPISALPSPDDDAGEFWMHDESARALVGRRSGIAYRLADTIAVRLVEAAPLTGGLRFAIDETRSPPVAAGRGPGRGGPRVARGKRLP